MNNLIFEIGVENIPARFITSACKQLKEKAEEIFGQNGISYSSLVTYGTYRRLILYVEGVPPKILEKEEKYYGPPAKLFKNEKGEYTPQACGFASSHNVSPDKLVQEELSGKGLVLCVIKKRPAMAVEKILPEVFIEIVKSLQFPKNMIWEESRFRFARPIRNLLALYGKKIIKLNIAGVISSRTTTGSLCKNFKKINVNSANDYFKNLERNHIIVKDEQRKEHLIKELNKVALRTELKIDNDEYLIEENVYLTEYPVCVFVKFPAEFLKLPRELILLVLKKQLKFFPCYNEKGDLQPYFVGIRDGISKGQKYVEEGFLNVFEARCRDALFFYENDLKLSSSQLIEKITNISFQENLGTIYDKAIRVRKILEYIVSLLNYPERDNILDCAKNLYLDLATNVVREFPELQGIMSYYYLPNWGITEEKMRKALGEVYYPISPKAALPSNNAGILLSISEKIDTITGDFLIGFVPTGSQDPHGLRRNAYGIIRMIIEEQLELPLRDVVKIAISNFELSEKVDREKILDDIIDFIFQRAENYFQEKGFTIDILQSVKDIFIREGNLLLVLKRISAIKEIYDSEIFAVLTLLYKRAKNILKGQKVEGHIDKTLFKKDAEKRLFDILEDLKIKKESYLSERNFLSAFKEIESLKEPLELFFKDVLVMTQDAKIRNNRLLLVQKVYNLFEGLADISKIQK